jgi:hypothetical protein
VKNQKIKKEKGKKGKIKSELLPLIGKQKVAF